MSERLCVVMPVYNEEAAIGGVLEKWAKALAALEIDFVIRPYNDGSKDASLAVMRKFASRHPDAHVEVRDKPNGGHGQTILTGYREAAADGFDWIFQIDSDDEMGPDGFAELWNRKDQDGGYDFLVGIRDGRVQALPRKVISFVSRCCVRLFYGRKTVWDVNSPYRLMRVAAFKSAFERIPLSTFAPNVILSGIVAREGLRFYETRVPQHDRTTGEVSIKKWKLLKAAVRSFAQTVAFSFSSFFSKRSPFEKGVLAILCVMATASVARAIYVGCVYHTDFQWMPAKILLEGENPYLYSLNHLPWRSWAEIAANQIPSCLLTLFPWTLLDYPVACVVWTISNFAFTFVFFLFLYKTFFSPKAECAPPIRQGFLVVVLLCLSGAPWRILVGNTQHLMFSLAFFMPALYFFLRGRHVLSDVLMALCFFKYTTVAPLLLVFVGLRAWMAIAVAVALHVAATCGAAIWLHESPVTLIVQSLQVGAMLTGHGTSDIPSFLHCLGLSCAKEVALPLYALFGLLGLYVCQIARKDVILALASLAILSNVMFYHRAYDYVSLVFAMVLVARMLSDGTKKSRIDKAILVLIGLDVLYMFFGMWIVSSVLVRMMGYSVGGVGRFLMMPLEHILLLALVVKIARVRSAPAESAI